ncbi:hypothetical protein NLG97_g8946 [Lecanicillium saksenae]|uniref:Uncharacterized protein n=1 Tax=Lecanicillium saksenae TaxID=468837 RepID=A0ACC1QJV3_9HYPO|nr:hypothetical protein NLG97_g8946 [Lecanicillium saksenae]
MSEENVAWPLADAALTQEILDLLQSATHIRQSKKGANEKKLGLIGIFCLGLFTTLCSILRYTQINRIQFGDGNSTMLVVWGVIEFNVGNIVSSLPFLAPVCLRKAKDYRSKHSKYAYGSHNNSKNRGMKGSEAYKLTDVSQDKSAFATSQNHASGSEENILQKNNAIMKSVTYSVRVEDEDEHHHMGGRAI